MNYKDQLLSEDELDGEDKDHLHEDEVGNDNDDDGIDEFSI